MFGEAARPGDEMEDEPLEKLQAGDPLAVLTLWPWPETLAECGEAFRREQSLQELKERAALQRGWRVRSGGGFGVRCGVHLVSHRHIDYKYQNYLAGFSTSFQPRSNASFTALRLVPMIRRPGIDAAGPVDLFEEDDEREFVLEREPAE